MPPRVPSRTSFAAAALACALSSSACLVVSLHPAYDDDSIAWDEGLVGTWHDVEDKIDVTIERAEWRSYTLQYKHPVDAGTFTAHLTIIGDSKYFDLMPERGQDYGLLLVPVHALVKVDRNADVMTVAALDYDRLLSVARRARRPSEPATAVDQKENVFLTSPTRELRQWLRVGGDRLLGAPATFTRVK